MVRLEVTRVRPAEIAKNFGVNVYREAYAQGITVSQHLERMDPTDEYKGDDPARQLDAFERVMQASGIVATGDPRYGLRASTWEEANQTVEKRALMHELFARVWRQNIGTAPVTPMGRTLMAQGQRANDGMMFSTDSPTNSMLAPYVDDTAPRAKHLVPPVSLASIVARTTAIEGSDAYRTLYIVDDFNSDNYRLKRVTEGANIPATTMISGEHTLRIHKYGRALRSTYEQIRRQRLDRIAWIMGRMAIQAEIDKVSMVMNTIINGDGNANTSAPVITLTSLDPAATAGTLTLKAWLLFRNRFLSGYRLDVVLAQEAVVSQLQLLPVNTVNGMPLALLPAGQFGQIMPMQNLLAGGVEYGLTPDAPSLKVVGLDSSQAVERVTEVGGTISEIERYINNQTQMVTMTETEGYGLLDTFGATRILQVNA